MCKFFHRFYTLDPTGAVLKITGSVKECDNVGVKFTVNRKHFGHIIQLSLFSVIGLNFILELTQLRILKGYHAAFRFLATRFPLQVFEL
jgi:hypothetical protein